MKNWISDNGGMLAVMAVALAILAAYGEWRIGVAVDAALADKNYPSDATIATINGELDVHESQITHMGERQDFTEEQLRDMANILMRRPE